MKHIIYFDETIPTIVIRVIGECSINDAEESVKAIEAIIEEQGKSSVIIDLRRFSASLDKEVRKILQDPRTTSGVLKMAMVTPHPSTRILGKIATSIMGRTKDTGFFKTEEEARIWIKTSSALSAKTLNLRLLNKNKPRQDEEYSNLHKTGGNNGT
ncbi:STAS/SEC14 domain-containing protein [bacterium]|nr:STAS/SEC14 domain-containing protein [bacterium]